MPSLSLSWFDTLTPKTGCRKDAVIAPVLQNIVVGDILGEGHFGKVYHGIWGNTTPGRMIMMLWLLKVNPVALKSIPCLNTNMNEFISEAKMLA